MELHYGEPISDQDTIGTEPQPGDLIEISCGIYEHWTIYVGDGYVVHLSGIDTKTPGLKSVMEASVKGTQAVVKKELLSEVAAGCEYQINNKHDRKRQVRSPKEIVKTVLELVGQNWPYKLTRKNCKSFVMEQRYGEPLSDQTRFDPEPQPGDLIEFFRSPKYKKPSLRYQHWAVYVGDAHVVHLINEGSGISGSSSSYQGVVKKELLVEVAAGCKYQVNNKYDEKFTALPTAEIVQNALELVGQKRSYNLIYQNCEHFATELRYGVACSDQVKNFSSSNF